MLALKVRGPKQVTIWLSLGDCCEVKIVGWPVGRSVVGANKRYLGGGGLITVNHTSRACGGPATQRALNAPAKLMMLTLLMERHQNWDIYLGRDL